MLEILCCPRDRTKLFRDGAMLQCENGHSYPIVQGIPVLLLPENTRNHAIDASLELVMHGPIEDDFNGSGIHPQVKAMLPWTNGILYKNISHLSRYPIPQVRLPEGAGRRLLDVGCNWGRWTFAAARQGYRAIGLDPHLESLVAAQSVAAQLGLKCEFVCGDARSAPFKDDSFETVFSYSVVQHFSKHEARQILREISRLLIVGGTSKIQMPNRYGIRSIYHLLRRRFAEGDAFDVRYWGPGELLHTFESLIGPSELSVDGYFGLGVQPDDADLMPLFERIVVGSSEFLRVLSASVPPLKLAADSLYITSRSR